MKKIYGTVFVSLFLLSILCLSISAQSFAADNIPNQEELNQFFVTQSINLTESMGELAKNQDYVKLLFNGNDEETANLFSNIGKGDYSSPSKVIMINISHDTIDSMVNLYFKAVDKRMNFSENLYKNQINSIIASYPSEINGYNGIASAVVTNALSVGKSFQLPNDFTGYTYTLLLYDEYASMTLYYAAGDEVIVAKTSFLFLRDDIREFLNNEQEIMDELNNIFKGLKIDYIDEKSIPDYIAEHNFTGTETLGVNDLNELFITKSIEATALMGELAGQKDYFNVMYPYFADDIMPLLTEISEENILAPEKAVIINVSDETIDWAFSFINGKSSVDKMNLTEDVHKAVVERMFFAMPSYFNSQGGTDVVLLASVLPISNTFLQPDDFKERTYVLLMYKNFISLSSYSISGEGVITAATTPLYLNEDFRRYLYNETTLEQIINYMDDESVKAEMKTLGLDAEYIKLNGLNIEYVDGETIAGYK